MAQLSQVFDATQVDPGGSFEPIPAGEYTMVFTDSEIKETKAGTGTYLQLTAEVVDGQYKGRLIWERINLSNPNATAVKIGQEVLSSICHVTGVPSLQDSAQLHGIPFKATVAIQVSEQYGNSNEIKGYKTSSGETAQDIRSGTAPAAPAPAPVEAPAAPAPAEEANKFATGNNPFRK